MEQYQVFDGVWIENTGTKPDLTSVDIKLNRDVDDWPGIIDTRYAQTPDDWDWNVYSHSVAITHYRQTLLT